MTGFGRLLIKTSDWQCQGTLSQYPRRQIDTQSIKNPKLVFPSVNELRVPKVSRDTILRVRGWKKILDQDARSPTPQWTAQERDVMRAASVKFRIDYGPNKVYTSHCREMLEVWRKGLEADAQSTRPRWTSQQRAADKSQINRMEAIVARSAAEREQKGIEAPGLAAVLCVAVLCIILQWCTFRPATSSGATDSNAGTTVFIVRVVEMDSDDE